MSPMVCCVRQGTIWGLLMILILHVVGVSQLVGVEIENQRSCNVEYIVSCKF